MKQQLPAYHMILQQLVGGIVDHFMVNRPLNLMLKQLVDRNGQIVYGPIDLMKRVSMLVAREHEDVIVGCYLRMHGGELLGVGTALSDIIPRASWNTAFTGEFITVGDHKVTVDYDDLSHWLDIRCPEFDELLKRVCELRAA